MIGIIGGGISGLFLLHLLREAGIEAILLEADPNPGGVMQSREVRSGGRTVTTDLGPQRTRLTPALAPILERAGLADSVLRAPKGLPFSFYHGGRLHPAPFSPWAAVRTGLVSWPGKARALADLVTGPPRPTESVAGALRRKLGPEVYERLAGPILGGLYGSDPEEMEARHTLLPILARTGGGRSLLLALLRASGGGDLPVISFRGGMGALPTALAELHRDRVRLGVAAEGLERRAGGGFVVTAGGERYDLHEVVLTLPAAAAARLLEDAAPEAAARIARLRYNPLAVVPLLTAEGAPLPELGTGFKMTLESPFRTRGVTAHGALFAREGLFSAFLGGMGAEAFVERDDAEIAETAREEFRVVTGADPSPLLVHRTWMPAWDRSWAALDGLELPPGLHLSSAYADRPGISGRLESARRLAGRLTPR